MCSVFVRTVIYFFFFLMIRRPPRSTRTDTLFPYTTLFLSNTISPLVFNRVNLTDFPFGAPTSRHLAGKKRVEHEMIFGGRATAIMLFISCLIMGGTAAQASQYLQCVTYARQISGVQLSGNANTWWDHAEGVYEARKSTRLNSSH